MKIAIPTADGRLAMHFGHCQQFALIDVDETSRKAAEPRFLTPPPHEPGVLPAWLSEQGATVIVAGGMGQRAQQLFTNHGIRVVLGAPAETPEAIVAAFLDETLAVGENPCDH